MTELLQTKEGVLIELSDVKKVYLGEYQNETNKKVVVFNSKTEAIFFEKTGFTIEDIIKENNFTNELNLFLSDIIEDSFLINEKVKLEIDHNQIFYISFHSKKNTIKFTVEVINNKPILVLKIDSFQFIGKNITKRLYNFFNKTKITFKDFLKLTYLKK